MLYKHKFFATDVMKNIITREILYIPFTLRYSFRTKNQVSEKRRISIILRFKIMLSISTHEKNFQFTKKNTLSDVFFLTEFILTIAAYFFIKDY